MAGGVLTLSLQAAHAQDDTGPVAPLPPPAAETVLPRTGIDPTVSDLREHLLQSYGDAEPNVRAGGPDLQITGQLGLAEEYTSDVGASGSGGGGRGSDAITQLQPGITIVDTSQRLRVSLDYAPTGQIYAVHSGYSQFAQQFTGDVLATALPGWLYVDLRGNVSQQAVFGGLGPSSTINLAPNDRQTDSSVSFSPYLSRQFGTHGTVEFGAGYVYSATDAPGIAAGTATAFDGAGAYGSSYLATKRGFASYETGEDLGRVRNKIGTDDSFYDGSGALAGGRRLLLTDDASYAATRLVTLLGQVGYEDLSYPRSNFAYSGPVAAGGVKLTPKPGSYVTVEYRYLDGFGSAYVQGSVQATARIRVFGGYSAGISTYQQDVQTNLLDGGLSDSATGAAASVLQAAPLLQGDNSFGANQNLTRTHRLDATATYLGDRDTATLSVSQQTTDPVGRQVGQFAQVSTRGAFGSVSLSHELSPILSVTGFVEYGSNHTGLARVGTASSGQTVSVAAGLNCVFTQTLSGYLRFGGTYLAGGSAFASSGAQGLGGGETTVTLGAVKRF